jgi:peroxiredoxin Q/BCP
MFMKDQGRKLTVGEKAPDFTLQDENGSFVNLKQLEGSRIILYFYPKDFTPGCTKEACEFREYYPVLKDNNTYIYGISRDTPKRHKQFIVKFKLPFHLLSDNKGTVAKMYGAVKENSILLMNKALFKKFGLM